MGVRTSSPVGALFGNTAGELLGEAIGPIASFLAGTNRGRAAISNWLQSGTGRVGRVIDDSVRIVWGTIRDFPKTYREPKDELQSRRGRLTAPIGIDDVPSLRNGQFQRWFNRLTPDELDIRWANPEVRSKIEARLRHPGGFHEWLPVSRAPRFKRWGITAEQIRELRTPVSDVRFLPEGSHGGRLSTTIHNELFRIIDTAPDYSTFVRNLQDWAGSHPQS